MAEGRVRRAIVAMLGLMERPVHRTKLVKLLYLADCHFCEGTGRTITGLEYAWDNYGPNAVSNAIVKEADRLASKGKIKMAVRESVYGSPHYLYWVDGEEAVAALNGLDPGQRQAIIDAARRYGPLSVQQIVTVSKRTRPFQRARQYELLKLEERPEARAAREALLADPDFAVAARAAIEDFDPDDTISLEEMDRRYFGGRRS